MLKSLKLILFLTAIFLRSLMPAEVCGQQLQAGQYRNLVMEGGGIRGIAYGGALAELERKGVLQNIERVGGTSAGAIQAMLLAVGYSPAEITRITNETNIKKFADGRFFFAGGVSRMVNKFGWYRGDRFSEFLGELLKEKTGNPDLTLAELHQLAGRHNFRDLYVMGTNLSKQKAEVLSHETYPDMKVKDAVRISMSIPLYFKAVGMDSTGQLVSLKKRPPAGVSIMVDGGITANFPIHIFDEPRYFTSQDSATLAKGINPETLGLRLDRPEQIAYDQQQDGLAPYQIDGFNDYMSAFYTMILENLNRATLKPEDWQRTISINTLQYAPRIRKMLVADKEQLLKSGEAAVKEFFSEQ